MPHFKKILFFFFYVVDAAENIQNARGCQTVEYDVSFLAVFDDSDGKQRREMLGNRGLVEADRLRQFGYGAFAVAQAFYYHQTRFVRKRLANARLLFKIFSRRFLFRVAAFHTSYINVWRAILQERPILFCA